MALIEIDGLPFLNMVDLSMAMLVITRWYPCWSHILPGILSGLAWSPAVSKADTAYLTGATPKLDSIVQFHVGQLDRGMDAEAKSQDWWFNQ